MDNLIENGYLIQRKKVSDYCGIEGDNWYLNYISDDQYFLNYYNKNIDGAWKKNNFLDCCVDNEYIGRYIQESAKYGIEFRILFCSSEKKAPIFSGQKLGKQEKFLGYDYAYCGGSYYSCVLNDICSKRIKEFERFKLNENGLFETYEKIEEFVSFREKLKNADNNYCFEEGEFTICKLTELLF